MSNKSIESMSLITDRVNYPDRPHVIITTFRDGSTSKRTFKTLPKALKYLDRKRSEIENDE